VIGKFFVPIILLFWILVFAFLLSYRERISEDEKLTLKSLLGIPLMVFAGFIFTSFGTDPSGRYFLPIYLPLAIWIGFAISKINRPLILYILGIFVVIYQVFGVISMARKEPYITTQFYEPAQVNQSYMNELITFLNKNDEKYGFSNYWVSYPLAFLSDENIISLPLLPYHPDLTFTSRDNRIPSYNEVLKFQNKYFFITTKNPELDKLLSDRFSENGIGYHYEIIGDFHIYYALSQPIDPEKIGLYEDYK
jgi:4-amino-4-deoxy-L-arabinose transferase-like glycosyltransferase